MGLILCLETTTKACSVALSRDGQCISIKEIVSEKYSHSENLTVFVESILKSAGISVNQLDAVAFSVGPGSYTGLRIGCSTAKGLCYSLDIPLISIDTLEAMTHAMEGYKVDLYCPMLDARRMEVYTALFDKDKSKITETEAKIITDESFENELKSNKILFFGDGAEKCKSTITSPNAEYVDGFYPTAKSMAQLAEKKFVNKDFVDVAYFEPFYLKDFIAGKPKKLI